MQSEDEIIQQLQENLKGCKFTDDLLGKDGAIKKCIQKIDNPDGTLRWVFTAGSWVVSSPASGTERTVYVGANYGNLFAGYGIPPAWLNRPAPCSTSTSGILEVLGLGHTASRTFFCGS